MTGVKKISTLPVYTPAVPEMQQNRRIRRMPVKVT